MRLAENELRKGIHRACVAGALGAIAALAQAATAASHVKPGAVVEIAPGPVTPVEAVREVDNPASGARWLLVRDVEHPAGPGRWIRMDQPEARTGDAQANQRASQNAKSKAQSRKAQARSQQALDTQLREEAAKVRPPAPILFRGGDPIVVVQSTPVISARLAAVALQPATAGKLIEARLKTTHARVWVIAMGPGRAALAPPGVTGR